MDNLTALAERTDAAEPDPAAPFSDDPEQRALVGAWATSILVVSVVIFMIAWRRHTQAMKKAGLAAVESTSTSAAGASDDAQWSGAAHAITAISFSRQAGSPGPPEYSVRGGPLIPPRHH